MCRYSFHTYKSHFACFNCRKTFKQPNFSDILQRDGKAYYFEKLTRKPDVQLTDRDRNLMADVNNNYKKREIKCPECGAYMADLGLDFRSPKKTAEKEWKIIQGLYTIGKSFYGCGCYGMGYVPNTPNDYQAYLFRTLQEYEYSIAHYQQKTFAECRDKMEHINYWNEKILLIKKEIESQEFAV